MSDPDRPHLDPARAEQLANYALRWVFAVAFNEPLPPREVLDAINPDDAEQWGMTCCILEIWRQIQLRRFGVDPDNMPADAYFSFEVGRSDGVPVPTDDAPREIVLAMQILTLYLNNERVDAMHVMGALDEELGGKTLVQIVLLTGRLIAEEHAARTLSGTMDVSAQLLAPPPELPPRPENCPQCSNVGYLLGQTYGTAEIPDGWTPIQACDTCQAFESDGLAAWSAKLAHQAPATAYFPSAIDDDLVAGSMSSEGQGEWAILWTEPSPPEAPSAFAAAAVSDRETDPGSTPSLNTDTEVIEMILNLAAALPNPIDGMRLDRAAMRLRERSAQLNRTGWTLGVALGLIENGATASDLPDAETLAKLTAERLAAWSFDLSTNPPDPTMAIARRPFDKGFADPRPTFTLRLTAPHDALGPVADGLRRTGAPVRFTLTEARSFTIDAVPSGDDLNSAGGRWHISSDQIGPQQ